ncbi:MULTISPECIES: protein kinase domain-containing protein [unclassified Luteimonas]
MDDATRWKRVWELFDRVAETPSEGREALLAALEPDALVREEVLALLAADDAATAGPGPGPGSTPMLAPGALVGHWRVDALLGRGGMGEVYLVTRTGADFEQRAALKLMLRMQSDEDRARFAAERRILARLEHPAIAHLLDGSEYQGTPYAVMEYVDGLPLNEYARDLPLHERLQLVLQACDAVGHAHRHLVVHRDLKPGNILVTADGQLKLLDFGIAKHLSADDGLPQDATRVIRASPDYCAPEQLNGGAISTATDVYALGVILFELVTGERPWQLGGMPLMRALERLALQEPPRASNRLSGASARALRGDIDNIIRKALQPNPGQRYRTTDELAEDIRAHLDQRPVKARKPTIAYVCLRALRRHRVGFAAAAIAVASVVAGVTGVVLQGREAAIERDHARREIVRNNAVRQYMTLMFRSAGELQADGDVTARDVLTRAAAQVADEFGSDRAAYADISLALSELFFQINDYTGARPLLERLVADGAVDDDVQAMARHDLAQISFRETRPDDAAGLLQQAQAFWAGDPRRYRSELLDSRLLQSQLERTRGDIDLAVRTLEDALPQRIELSGPTHRETVVLVNNLGIAYFQAGRLEDAASRFQQAHGLWQELGQDRSADALNTLNNWASVEARLSRPEVAIGIMEDALALRRELYGPSAAMAALMNNMGKTLSQLGRHEEAVPLLRDAIDMGRIHAGGETGAIAVAASLGLADALSGSGHPQGAWELIDEVGPGILETYGTPHVLSAMLDISRARAHHAGGAVAAAQAALVQARSGLVALGPAGANALQQLEALQQGWSDQPSASE